MDKRVRSKKWTEVNVNLPMNQEALNNEPMRARSFGYDNSPIIDEAATIANGIPNPSRNRAMTNIATENYV